MSDQWRTTIPFLPETLVKAVADLAPRELHEFEALLPLVRNGPNGWQLLWAVEAEKKARTALLRLGEAMAADFSAMQQGTEDGVQDLDLLGISTLRTIVDRGTSNDDDMRADGWSAADRLPGASHALVIAEATGEDKARALLDAANRLDAVGRHATYVRVCLFRDGDDPVALLHARDDPERGSTLRSLLRVLDEHGTRRRILLPYRTSSGVCFFGVPPPLLLTNAAARIFVEAPQLYQPDRRRPLPGRWSASDPPPLSRLPAQQLGQLLFAFDGRRLFDLRRSRFVGQLELTEESERPQIFIRQPLDKRDAAVGVSILRDRLKAVDSSFGTRLRLARGAEGEGRHGELDRVRRQIAKLRREERRLEAASAPRLRLLRCQEAQFDSVVRALGMVHAAGTGAELAIRYSCESTAAGLVHYVMFDKAAELIGGKDGTSRIWDFGIADIPGADVFWSDPAWSRYYAMGAANGDWPSRVRVFVPAGLQLEPFPHAWDAAEFDDFIAAAVRMWAHGEVAIGPGSVLVFENAAAARPRAAAEADVQVTVLPAGAFAPLEPPIVTWLNDVSVSMARVPSYGALTDPARQMEAELIASHVAGQQELSWKGSMAALAAASASIAREADGVLAQFAGHVRGLAVAGERWREKITELERQLEALAAHYAGLHPLVDRIEEVHLHIVATSGRGASERDQAARAALEELGHIERLVNEDCVQIENRVDALETRLAMLRKRLKELALW